LKKGWDALATMRRVDVLKRRYDDTTIRRSGGHILRMIAAQPRDALCERKEAGTLRALLARLE